jgi:hypothetical protein
MELGWKWKEEMAFKRYVVYLSLTSKLNNYSLGKVLYYVMFCSSFQWDIGRFFYVCIYRLIQ